MQESGVHYLDEVGCVIICSVVRALTDDSRLQLVLCSQSSCTILSLETFGKTLISVCNTKIAS